MLKKNYLSIIAYPTKFKEWGWNRDIFIQTKAKITYYQQILLRFKTGKKKKGTS